MGSETAPGNRHGSSDEDVREFRLEGLGLALVRAVLLAALSGSFYLGRWYESRRGGEGGPSKGNVVALPGADASTRSKVVSAEEGVTAVDDVGEDAVAEPRREARGGTVAERPDETAEAAASSSPEPGSGARAERPAPPAGPWTIQVAAVRDRRSAEALYGELVDKGFAARIDPVRDGPDTVYKVRVGGFAERGDTGETAEKLKAAGYQGWVTKAD